ncbi:thiamine-phosphate kinase [Acidipila sp. EB88]|uniref:thiamine-phosphate kinase n=1 Tax=Acidipila sp. EB88 TaxID=2305226 RepID=UPI000F5DBAEF|nr:thiamine-phosphate kinase [Acidipila sp. EB88]RRA48550.1 thiamine-phosphate kinase [Acidipila sp. EB88]
MRSTSSRAVRVGIGDDCAVLAVPRGHELTVTTDLLLETTHFRRDWHTPEAVGHRCLARGLSDLAAMGARPLAAFLSFAIPPELAGAWASRFLRGLLALAQAAKVPLAGGDTAQAPGGRPLFTADILLLGSVPTGTAMLRSGARAGDLVYVSGALGGAAAELATLAAGPGRLRRLRTASREHPHLFPQPRLAQGLRLRSLATAAIDLSDGLSTDLAHLCEASQVGAEIEQALLPVHALALRSRDPHALALHGGEDYELLFTASAKIPIPRTIQGVKLHRIGRITPAPGARKPRLSLLRADGTREVLENGGWEHFRTPASR